MPLDTCRHCGNPDTEIRVHNGDRYCRTCCADLIDWHYDMTQKFTDTSFDYVGSPRRFGVELEVHQAPELSKLFTKTPFGSKRDGSAGVFREIFSPPLQGNAGFNHIDELCTYALRNKWKVNDGCGFHIHVDMHHVAKDNNAASCKDLSKIVLGYFLTEEYWSLMVPEKRRQNSYCIPLNRVYTLEQIMKRAHEPTLHEKIRCATRYAWVAPCAFWNHGTVEIRLHTATVHPVKVKNWLRVHLRFIDWLESKSIYQISTHFINEWLTEDMLGIHRKLVDIWKCPELGEFYQNRSRRFGSNALVDWNPSYIEVQ